MKITVFGGTFDPPHVGHIAIARALLEKKYAERVWFLPVGEHAFDKQFLPAKHRLAMLQLTLEPNQKIERFELQQQGKSYTYQTLSTLAAMNPQHSFSFVIGSDNLARFSQWQNYQDLLAQFPVFVYPREGSSMEPLLPGMIAMTNVAAVTVSSTQVRSAVAAGESIIKLVDQKVALYIHEHSLYV